MAGNSFQSPVASEPSFGTPHPHRYRFYNGASLGVGDVDIDTVATAGLTSGAKEIFLWGIIQSANISALLEVQDTSGNIGGGAAAAVINQRFYFTARITLDANHKFRVHVGTNTIGTVFLEMTEYLC
jgi:hypothetical protein